MAHTRSISGASVPAQGVRSPRPGHHQAAPSVPPTHERPPTAGHQPTRLPARSETCRSQVGHIIPNFGDHLRFLCPTFSPHLGSWILTVTTIISRERRSSVSTSAWHAVGWGCKNLVLNIRDCVSIAGCGRSVFGAPL